MIFVGNYSFKHTHTRSSVMDSQVSKIRSSAWSPSGSSESQTYKHTNIVNQVQESTKEMWLYLSAPGFLFLITVLKSV